MDHLGCQAVYDTLYLPQEAKNGMVFAHDGVDYVNSYMPLKVPHVDVEWQSSNAWKLCEDHIRNILPNDWEVVLQWMAYNVQNAGRKILWSPIAAENLARLRNTLEHLKNTYKKEIR